MSILSSTGAIFVIREPVCGRYGMQRLLDLLRSDQFNVHWNGQEEITVVTFNKRRTICSILHYDGCGIDRTTRKLKSGRFQVLMNEGLLPSRMTRETLERLLSDGTIEGELRSEVAILYLRDLGLLG